MALDPKNGEARFELAMFRSMFGRVDESLAEIDAAIALSPTSFNKRSRGTILFYARRYDEAIAQFQQIAEDDPEYKTVIGWLINCYVMKGDYQAVFQAEVKQAQMDGASPETVEIIRSTFAAQGWQGVFRDLLERPRDPKEVLRGIRSVRMAEMYSQIGEFEKAYEYLEIGLEQRVIWMIHLARDPFFDPIRTDPRFQSLLKRIGLI